MDTRTIWVVLVASIVAAIALIWARSSKAQTDPDAWVIAQLRQAGSNLSKPHPIEFFLYLPSREAADRVAAKVRANGFSAKVERAAKGEDWVVLATKTMQPVHAELVTIRRDFTEWTKVERGGYDGWGAPIVK